MQFLIGGNGEAAITAYEEDGDGSTTLAFGVRNSGSRAERMRIDSSGRVLVGATSAAIGSRMDVHAGSDGENILGLLVQIRVVSFTANTLGVNSSEAVLTAGNASSNGTSLVIRTANSSGTESERLRISSTGKHTITGASNGELTIKAGSSSGNDIIAFENSSGTTRGNLTYDTDNDFLLFNVNQSERSRITSGGDLLLGGHSENL